MDEAKRVLKAVIETAYTDGIDDLEFWHDEAEGTLWGNFRDGDKTFPFEIDLESGTIRY